MQRAIYALIAGVLLLGVGCSYAVGAGLEDPLDGSNLGEVSSIAYGPGWSDQAAVFNAGNDYIRYNKSYFPAEGTVSFFVKPKNATGNGGKTVLDTAGLLGKAAGDMTVMLTSGNAVFFGLWDTGGWKSVVGTTALSTTDWSYVVLSYGSAGMKMWVNGLPNGSNAFTGTRRSVNVFAGDFQGDNTYANSAWAFPGSLDCLRTSATQSDPVLMSLPVAAVPEPSSLAALFGGLLSAVAVLRRRR